MKVKDLIKILRALDPNRELDMFANEHIISFDEINSVIHVHSYDYDKDQPLKEPKLEQGHIQLKFSF